MCLSEPFQESHKFKDSQTAPPLGLQTGATLSGNVLCLKELESVIQGKCANAALGRRLQKEPGFTCPERIGSMPSPVNGLNKVASQRCFGPMQGLHQTRIKNTCMARTKRESRSQSGSPRPDRPSCVTPVPRLDPGIDPGAQAAAVAISPASPDLDARLEAVHDAKEGCERKRSPARRRASFPCVNCGTRNPCR